MHQFVVQCDDYIQKIENISYQHKHNVQKMTKDESDFASCGAGYAIQYYGLDSLMSFSE